MGDLAYMEAAESDPQSRDLGRISELLDERYGVEIPKITDVAIAGYRIEAQYAPRRKL